MSRKPSFNEITTSRKDELILDTRRTIQEFARVGLVACAKSKRNEPLPAKELYSSELFKKTMRYTRTNYDRWYILSAKHGVVEPDSVLEPYDETLYSKSPKERRIWADKTLRQLLSLLPKPNQCLVFFHAGAKYREFLGGKLTEAGYHCEVPLEGLGIGEQLAWYDAHKKE